MLAVPLVGRVVGNGLGWEPYRLVDADGEVVDAVSAFLAELQAAGRSAATLRSYALDLLRWLRFCWAVGVPWDEASRGEARDFSRWMAVTGKPARPHWRHPDESPPPSLPTDATNAYAPSVRAHAETVLRAFYEFHREQDHGPVLNPFPLESSRRGRRANGHHNPMEQFRNERVGVYRPRIPERVPRAVPDETFNAIFARLGSNRDRALVAFYVSTGARASELLSTVQGGVDPGRQLLSVVRKGSGALQELPASTDAFVWLRLYQLEMQDVIPTGRRQPLFWTRRRPLRPLSYHAVHRMFERVVDGVGADVTLHALRHTAAYRMAEDPALPLTDVQWVLGHVHLTTTQIYLNPRRAGRMWCAASWLITTNRHAGPKSAPRPPRLWPIGPRICRCCSPPPTDERPPRRAARGGGAAAGPLLPSPDRLRLAGMPPEARQGGGVGDRALVEPSEPPGSRRTASRSRVAAGLVGGAAGRDLAATVVGLGGRPGPGELAPGTTAVVGPRRLSPLAPAADDGCPAQSDRGGPVAPIA